LPNWATLHRAGSKWLDRPREDCRTAASQYWNVAMTEEPMVEVFAHGRLFFPAWYRPPFGQMIPGQPNPTQPE
jgi:hypothetical protein